ncbi:MAG TPA: hypothetical protein VFG51_00100 [Candidatus Saccharimonadia bacterium]|nr:hypothetical protein [Candidatus Saccharimonadia bacterium]
MNKRQELPLHERESARVTPRKGYTSLDAGVNNARQERAQDISEAYDIKNVDFRNLLTVVMGTVSNQTGESFDKAMLRTKSADEIYRRFNALTAQRDELLAACKKAVATFNDTAAVARLLRHPTLADACDIAAKGTQTAIASVEGKQ